MRSLPARLLGLTVSGTLLACLPAVVNPTPAQAVAPPNVQNNQTTARYPLANALTLTVNITTRVDTDGDGRNDKVQLRIKRPDTAGRGDADVRVPTIIEPSIYNGTMRSGIKQHPAKLNSDGTPPQLQAPLVPPAIDHPARNDDDVYRAAPAETWTHMTSERYLDDEFVPRGYAVAELDALGTGHSEGCIGVGSKSEQAGVVAAIDWLNGRAAGVDDAGLVVTAADWSNGKAALQGLSYNGALSIEGAASGVTGLKTIVTEAGIADWYRYVRSNGAVVGAAGTGYAGWDLDNLASEYNNGPSPCGDRITSSITDRLERDTGDRNAFWDERDYTTGLENRPNASVFVVQGIKDTTVRPENATLYWNALQAWGVESKLWITQAQHETPYVTRQGEFLRQLRLWYDHYLYDLPNGITAEPRVDVQQSDLTWTTQAVWPALAADAPDGPGAVTLSTRIDNTKTARSLAAGANWANSKVDSMTQNTEPAVTGPVAYNALTNSDYMDLNQATLKYLTPVLNKSVTLEGTPSFSVVAKTQGASPYLNALVVDVGDEGSRPRVISRGWLDTRNYAAPGTLDLKAQVVVPEDAYRLYKWDGQPIEATVPQGHRIGLVLLPVDSRNTPHYVGENGKQSTTLSIGTETSSVTLPVKSGKTALPG
ncbi:CocE/NonD family hydrolase [Kitasatospora indigofera]|uniref:CocE/NonD family hydrolase n=1 Tax=Kitasatospora indigofera TaxID=67307 RepID=UPI0036AE1CF2